MSLLEQRIRRELARRPEVEQGLRLGLVNRRALGRFLVRAGVAPSGDLGAVVAALRRLELPDAPAATRDLFPAVRIAVKDRILLLDFEKDRALLQRLERLLPQIEYDRGETLKVVLGTESFKLILDERRERSVRSLFERAWVRKRLDGISEISMMFPEEAISTPGILALVTRELLVREVTVTEFLTASPELLIYLRDEHVPRAYEALRGLQGKP